ncbi:MAG: energy transducer TonB [Bacteroidota bacterium]
MKKLILVLFLLNGFVLGSTGDELTYYSGGEEEYLAFAEVMPEPANGLAALMKKIQYPAIAKSARLEGKVIAIAYVNENGDVDDVKIIKGLEGGCSEAVEKVLRESKFKPGMKEGKAVKVKLTMSFVFKL